VSSMLPGLPGLATDRDIAMVTQPQREIVELRTDTERVLYVMEPITVDSGGSSAPVTSVNGLIGDVVLTKASVGLTLVNNTADVDKPLSTAMVGALADKAETVHAHALGDVTGLTAALATKLDVTAGGEQEPYGPGGAGLSEWTCDPVHCSAHYQTASGVLFLVRHRFRKAMNIDEIGFTLWQAGTSPGAYSGVAVYEDGNGTVNRLAQSVDMGAVFTSVGAKSIPLAAPLAVAAGEFRWIGYLWQGSTPPHLTAPPGPEREAMMNVGRRRTVFQTGQSGFPSTLNVSAMTLNTTTYWFSFTDNP
jgi:hypothetical protein